MILFLCYIFPPLAVLLMGRPFSAMVNCFFTIPFWKPGVNHALVHYADYKGTRSVRQLKQSIDQPAWAREYTSAPTGRRKKAEVETSFFDDPQVGKNGTRFRTKD